MLTQLLLLPAFSLSIPRRKQRHKNNEFFVQSARVPKVILPDKNVVCPISRGTDEK